MNAYSKQIIPNDTNVFSYRVLKDSLVSDEVFEKLTGIRGAFRTRIAYVVQKKWWLTAL